MNNKPRLVTAIIIVLTLVASGYFTLSLNKRPTLTYAAAKTQDITQGVNVDGTVAAAQDLSLAFEQGGTVSEVDVQAGQQVKKGQVLVRLDTGDAGASVSQAQAQLSSAQANYQKLLNGDTSADIDVAQTTLDNAKTNLQAVTTQEQQMVQNALATLLNSGLQAIPSPSNLSTQSPTISGSYSGTQQGQYTIKLFSTGSGMQFSTAGLETAQGTATNIGPVALGSKGLTIQFPSGQLNPGDTWTVSIPNTSSTSYVSNENSYNAALQAQNQALTTAQAAVDSAQAALQLKQTPARPEDIAAAKATVDQAQAALDVAENSYGKDLLTAPIDGTITSVDTKVGQTVAGSTLAPGPDAIKMISNDNNVFQLQAYVSETDVGKIKVGDNANVTLSAYGSGTVFNATVIAIDPSGTVQGGINTYKTTLEFTQDDPRIKEGMDASIAITDQTQSNVLTVPQSSVIQENNQNYVLVQVSGKPVLIAVQTGLWGLDGNVQITGGLSQGQQVASFGN